MRLLDSNLMRAYLRQLSPRSERGVSLIATMMILASLSITGTSAIYYSSRNTQAAERSQESGDARALAESGMNFARATLWEAANLDDPNAVPSETVDIEGTTVTYYGTYDAGASEWTLTGEATVPNPSGVGEITRAVQSKVAVAVGAPETVWVWGWSMSKPDSCAILSNNIEYTQPLKIDGNVCMENSAKLMGDYVEISGTLTLNNSSGIGKSGDPADYVNLVGGCTRSGLHVCNAGTDNIYASEFRTVPFSETKPVLDWTTWYSSADLGPATPCTAPGSFTPGSVSGGFDNNASADSSLGTVDLTPASSYTCTSPTGEISWDNSTHTLTADGVIFIDGDVQLSRNVTVVYQGKATIYVNGDLDISNSFRFCGGTSACDATWDTFSDAIIFAVSGDFALRNNTIFQGGAVVDGDYSIQNNAENYGPVIATNFSIQNSGDTFIPISGAMPGLPPFGDTNTLPVGLVLQNVADTYISYTPGAGNDPN